MMLGIMALAGCSIGDDVPVANKAIDRFHAALNAGQFEPIYAGAAKDMKDTTPQSRLVALLAAVHRKLGTFKSGKSMGWNDNVNPAGHFVTISYEATYEHGPAAENFVYRIDGGHAALAGYHVNADALILG
jgi:hypothetical protein